MTWFKVDDSLAFHHKAVAAGNSALGLWVRAGSWSAQQLTDGYIPGSIVDVLGTAAQAARLVKVGLWTAVDNGFQFHQWNENGRQPTRKEVLDRRKKEAEKKQNARAVKAASEAAKREPAQVIVDCPQGTESGLPGGHPKGLPEGVRSTRPVPSRPVGKKTSSSSISRSASSEFEEFWSIYPRRTAKGAADKAWAKAIRRAEPAAIVEAARRYAESRKGQDPKFTPHPATWLNQGRWDDEPEQHLQLVSGGYQPFRNPVDPSVYDEDLLP